MKLSNQQFDRMRQLALGLAGIELVERHRELLDHRSRRLGILDTAGLDSLLSAAEKGEATATQQLLWLLTTKFTGFFRHPAHFSVAAEHALRVADQRGRARLWSAAAASGEEPYSLAMALIEAFGHEEPPAGVLATDLDADTLAVAQSGEYTDAAMQAVEPARRERFFTKTSVARRWSIVPSLRRLVEFQVMNLIDANWVIEGPFDVIFCRNVLMYLEAGRRDAVVERMASLLAPDGLLMLDPAEHLGKAGHLFMAGDNGVYSRRNAPSAEGKVERRTGPPHQLRIET
jgi:chemotaxis protein methyltransferase CheR